MKKITKKQIRLIKSGRHDVLMDCLEFILDSYNEDKWDNGYKSCLADLSVRSYRLAEHILKELGLEKKHKKEGVPVNNIDYFSHIIEEYYKNALNE